MAMKQWFYILAVSFVIHIQSATTLETVWLKDATPKFLTEKRTLSNTDFPDELAFHLTRRSETLNLNLRRNHNINPRPDIYFARKLQNGQHVLVKSRNTGKEDVAYYQDIQNGAFITVRCVKKSNEQCDRIISGNIRIGGRDYELQPAQTDVASTNMFEDPDHLGRQYVLEDQTHAEREYSVERKDANQENEKNTKQKSMSLLRDFQEQQEQKYLSASIATLSSRNISTLHNRGRTDNSRELPNIYYIKVAVLIDYDLWQFYVSTVHSPSSLTRHGRTVNMIQKYYSHIMNGVNLLYKGIEDPSIRINIILSEFIFFMNKHDFPHNKSGVVEINGVKHIDVLYYLKDLVEWDKKIDTRRKRDFSQGILFSRYTMYDEFISDTEPNGAANQGEVCNVGKRMSIVQTTGYVRTVYTAAHELGHSLGACHDGSGNATDCRAEDGFILAPSAEEYYPGKPYDKNNWLFSKCSVRAFKDTLKKKPCVKSPAPYYNDAEYRSYVIHKPGEVFTIEEQCELIAGRGSILCETASRDICLLMRCTDPKTGRCIEKYHGAATGSVCGRKRHCINGLCISK